MASTIQSLLEQILNAVYGEEVRGSIHDAIEQCYEDVSTAKTAAESATDSATTAAARANTASASAETVITRATNAASSAETAASTANTAATNANTKATLANNAATAATDAATSITQANTGALARAEAAITNANNAADSITHANTGALARAEAAITRANASADNADNMADDAYTQARSAELAYENATAAYNSIMLPNTGALDRANAVIASATTAVSNANSAANQALVAKAEAVAAADAAVVATSDAEDAYNEIMRPDTGALARAETAIANANAQAEAAFDAATDATTAYNSIMSEDPYNLGALPRVNQAIEDMQDAYDAIMDQSDGALVQINAKLADVTEAIGDLEEAQEAFDNATTYINDAITNVNNMLDTAEEALSDLDTLKTTTATNSQAAYDNALLASDAAIEANAAKTGYDLQKSAAESIQSSMVTATTRANTAAISIEGLTVTSQMLTPGSTASATVSTVDGHKNIHFQLVKGDPGASFVIKGAAYATIEALENNVTNPSIGDIYNVGSEAPYNLYRYTGSYWEDQGQIGTSLDLITTDDINGIWSGATYSGDTKYVDAAGLSYLVANKILDALNNKVDVVSGKGLSTVDFTMEYKEALTETIPGQISALDSGKVDKDEDKVLSDVNFTHALKNKLDGISAGANVTTVDSALSTSSTNPVQNSVVTTVIQKHRTDIAPVYDADATYAVGSYCMKDDALYRCTTAINYAEVWNSSHWTPNPVSITSEIESILSGITFSKVRTIQTST